MESTISFPTDARALAVTARNAFFMDMDPAGTNHDRISAGAGELLLDEPVSAAGSIVALTILVGHHADDDLVSNQVEVRVYDMVDHDRADHDGAAACFTLVASRQCTVGNSNDRQTLPLSAPLPVTAGQYIALFMAAGLASGGGPVAFATLGGTAHTFLFYNADVDQPTRANGTPEQYDWPGWHVEMAVTQQTPPDDGLDQTTHASEKSWVNIGHWTRESAGRSPAGRSPAGRSPADTVPVGNLVTHDGAVLFVADGSGVIYRSQDGGQSWDSLSAAPDQVTALALTTDGKTLLAAVRDVTLWFSGSVTGIFQSADNGDSWTPMAAMSPAAWQERLQNQRVLDYVRRGYGQRMLQRFMANDPRLHGQSQALAVTPDNNLVLGTADALWKSRTAWETWDNASFPRSGEDVALDGQTILALACVDTTVFAATTAEPGIVRRADDATDWRFTRLGEALGQVTALTVHPDGQTVVAATRANTLHLSRDSGVTWALLNDHLASLLDPGQVITLISMAADGSPRIVGVAGSNTVDFYQWSSAFQSAFKAAQAGQAKAEQALRMAKTAFASQLRQAKKQAATDLKHAKDAAAAKLQQVKEQDAAELKRAMEQAATDLQHAKEQAAAELQCVKEQAAAELKRAMEQAATDLQNVKEQDAAELKQVKEQAATDLQNVKEQDAAELKRVKEQAAATLQRVKAQAAQALAAETALFTIKLKEWQLLRDDDLLVLLPLVELEDGVVPDYSGYKHDFVADTPTPKGTAIPVAMLDSGAIDVAGLARGLTVQAWIKCANLAQPRDLITLSLGRFQMTLGIEELTQGQIFLRAADKSMDYLSVAQFVQPEQWMPWVFILQPMAQTSPGPQAATWLPRIIGAPGEFTGTDRHANWPGIHPITQPLALSAAITQLRVQLAASAPPPGTVRFEDVRIYRRALTAEEIDRFVATRRMGT